MNLGVPIKDNHHVEEGQTSGLKGLVFRRGVMDALR